MGRALSVVERAPKTCLILSRQSSLISQNPLALAVGSMSMKTRKYAARTFALRCGKRASGAVSNLASRLSIFSFLQGVLYL